MPGFVVENVKKIIGKETEAVISVFGVTYKGNVDDMRESPAMDIVKILNQEGFQVKLHDPHVESETYTFLSKEEAVQDSEMILVLTDHDEFKSYDYQMLGQSMKVPVVFDTRNIVKPVEGVAVINFGNLYSFLK